MKSEVYTKYKPIKGIPDKGPSEGREEGLRCSIEIMQEANFLRDSAKKKLMEKYSLSEETAEEKLLLYWK